MVYVAVVGASGSSRPDAAQLEDARTVGRELATAGAIVVCGGLDGVMCAVCEGAAERGGRSIGLLPGRERAEANESLEIALPTGLGEARNWLVVCASDVVIAIGGGYGTLSEIALALRTGKHVVGLRTWPLDGVEASADDARMHRVESAVDAVATALSLVGRGPAGEPRHSMR